MMECWKIGTMGFGIPCYWVSGKIQFDDKFQRDSDPLLAHYSIFPPLRYSMIAAKI
jgi:hypothetical protein